MIYGNRNQKFKWKKLYAENKYLSGSQISLIIITSSLSVSSLSLNSDNNGNFNPDAFVFCFPYRFVIATGS